MKETIYITTTIPSSYYNVRKTLEMAVLPKSQSCFHHVNGLVPVLTTPFELLKENSPNKS